MPIFNYNVTTGVSYIKIAKKDLNGVDNTLSLQELINLRIKFPDVPGVTKYKIVNVKEYPTYYLYETLSTLQTSSINYNKNYAVSASLTSSIEYPISSGAAGTYYYKLIQDYDNVTVNPLNAFNTSSGLYTVPETPNIKIYLTASVTFSRYPAEPPPSSSDYPEITLSKNFLVSQVGLNYTNEITSSGTTYVSTSNFPGVFFGEYRGEIRTTLSNSISYGDQLGLLIRKRQLVTSAPSPHYGNYHNVRFHITQSVEPSSGSNPETILEPYLTTTFKNSDCDVLINNADFNSYSRNFKRVHFDNGISIPSNYQQILSQSAEPADVKDFNYSLLSSINPKYIGSKNTTPFINVWVTSSLNKGNYGKTPSISVLDTCIYEIDFGGGTGPEIIGCSQLNMSGKIMNVASKDSVRVIRSGKNIIKQVISKSIIGPPGYDTYGVSNSTFIKVDDYNNVFRGNNKINDSIIVYPYDQDATSYTPRTSEILTLDFGIPAKSNFILLDNTTNNYLISGSMDIDTSKGTAGVVTGRSGSDREGYWSAGGFYSGSNEIILSASVYPLQTQGHLRRVTQALGTGKYLPGDYFPVERLVYSLPDNQPFDDINYTINKGERWFITLFSQPFFIGSTSAYGGLTKDGISDDGTLQPYSIGFPETEYRFGEPNPPTLHDFLHSVGVHEVYGARVLTAATGSEPDAVSHNFVHLRVSGEFSETRHFGGYPFLSGSERIGGFLLWKADQTKNTVILKSPLQCGNGVFTKDFTTEEINKNLIQITKDFGSNKN